MDAEDAEQPEQSDAEPRANGPLTTGDEATSLAGATYWRAIATLQALLRRDQVVVVLGGVVDVDLHPARPCR